MSSKQERIKRYYRQHEDQQNRKKRRSRIKFPLRVLFAGLLALVVVYFGIQFYRAVNQPLKTVTALSTSVIEEISATGYFVRSESVICQSYRGILQYVVNEGEKISQSELYANVYQDSSAAEHTTELQELTQRIEMLETALSYNSESGTSFGTRTESLSTEIQSLLLTVNRLASSRSYSLLEEEIQTLKDDIINRDFAFTSAEDVEATIASLKSRRDRLEASIGERERGLYSPEAGYFSAAVDGYEELLTPEALEAMTLEDYHTLSESTPVVPEDAVGKIVTDFDWRFVTELSSEDADRLTVGSKLNIQLDSTGNTDIQVIVEDIRRQNSSGALVILRSDRALSQLIGLRRQSIRIILSTVEGLKVPKDALRVNESYEMGVYVVTGMAAEFKTIEPLYETEEYYIVKTDPYSVKSLLVYDEIIISGRGLENKKVIA